MAPHASLASSGPAGVRSAASVRTGNGGGPVLNDPAVDLAAWRPSSSEPFDRRRAAHLLRRAGFGANLEEVDAAVAIGVDRMIDLLLTPSSQGLQEHGVTVLPNGEVLSLTYSIPAKRAQWLAEMTLGTYPLREKMALFWHDHFSVGSENIQAVPTMTKHINVFRRHGLGSFRQLLIEVTADPAMLYWLDNYLNGQRGRINENYGRELLELYSVGVNGGYTESDVQEASKCLTGWTLNGIDQFIYNSRIHVTGPKTVLGRTIDNVDGYRDVFDLVDVILAHSSGGVPLAARYVARKIWEYFVSPNHYPALIDELAKRWSDLGYDIRSLMSIVLRSNAFFASRRELVKSPVEIAVGALRNTSTPVGRFVVLGVLVEGMGLPLLGYTTPSGLAEGRAWIDSSAIMARANFANELTSVVGTRNGLGAQLDVMREIRNYSLTTAEQIVDHYLALLVDGDVPPLVRAFLVEFMNRIDTGPDPFQLTPAKINEKVRGLVHLIMSLPEYQMA